MRRLTALREGKSFGVGVLSETFAPALGIPASPRVYLIVLAGRPAR